MEGRPVTDGVGTARDLSWQTGVAILGLFAVLAYAVRPVLTPFVLFLLFLHVAWPWLDRPIVSRLAVGGTALILLWIVQVTGLLLAPFILALILAYVLNPVVELLERRMPRPAAILFLALPLAAIAALLVFLLAPAVANQVGQLMSNVPDWIRVIEGWIGDLRARLIGLGIQGINQQTVPELADIDAQEVVDYIQRRQSELAQGGVAAVLGIGRGLGVVLGLLGYLVLLPVLVYYLLRDWNGMRAKLADLVPLPYRERVLDFAGEYNRLLSRYLRGQLLLAAIVGLIVGVGFWIVGFPYALLLGLVAGVLNIVPYVGLLVSLAAAVLISLFSEAILASLVKVAIVFGVEQVLENIIGPRIVGDSVGLHPVWVILALVLFSFFFGFVGLLIAVPAAVLLKLVIQAGLERYRASGWYRSGTLGGEEGSEA
jgi:predicted PurR-regulated permease PerM